MTLGSLGVFFQHALAITAWKEFQGNRWALRCNPSSGNLHPTEGYLVVAGVEGLHADAAVHHYAAREHALERRAVIGRSLWAELVQGFPEGAFFIGLTSIHWREAWKYGERAYRYCQHDAGHALATCVFAAAMLGWQVRWLREMSDADVARVLGLERDSDFGEAEPEHPDLMAVVVPGEVPHEIPLELPPQAVDGIALASWQGKANLLSRDRVSWELIDAAADACAKPGRPATEEGTQLDGAGAGAAPVTWAPPMEVASDATCSASGIILQRRSAVSMDGRTTMPAQRFFATLDKLLPRPDRAPWSALGGPAAVHLLIFVHRVTDLAPGLYLLVRDPAAMTPLRESFNARFAWEKPAGCPEHIPLYQLAGGDLKGLASQVSCGQDIAGDGAFSLGMLAEFEPLLRRHGGWFYRRLFWETGMIGQVLYLEAEAAGLRGTGIGCFFDDLVHQVAGITGQRFQSLYHFTVGGPVDDPRLTTLPPYSESRGNYWQTKGDTTDSWR